MNKTWMSLTAGILDVICGAGYLIGGLILFIIGIAGGGLITLLSSDTQPYIPLIPFAILIAIASVLVILGILAVIGGTFAIRTKSWNWALTGSIIAFLISWILGIPAIVFTVLSRKDFNNS